MSSTQDTQAQSDRLTGMVKWFNNKAGYGFLTVCGEGQYANKDIFVHYTSIRVANSQYKYLTQGEYVEFEIVKSENDNHEFHASDVTGVKGGAIMCETRRLALSAHPDRTENFKLVQRSGPPRGSKPGYKKSKYQPDE